MNTDGGHMCLCHDGYTMSAGTCIDIDECKHNNGGCSQVRVEEHV